jgi:hypothetical protein
MNLSQNNSLEKWQNVERVQVGVREEEEVARQLVTL